jgi:hypothetical protein
MGSRSLIRSFVQKRHLGMLVLEVKGYDERAEVNTANGKIAPLGKNGFSFSDSLKSFTSWSASHPHGDDGGL